jgi:hypothetical protein
MATIKLKSHHSEIEKLVELLKKIELRLEALERKVGK